MNYSNHYYTDETLKEQLRKRKWTMGHVIGIMALARKAKIALTNHILFKGEQFGINAKLTAVETTQIINIKDNNCFLQ